MHQSSNYRTVILLIIASLAPVVLACAQEKGSTGQHAVTKIDEFISTRGAIVRFEDYKLAGFKTRLSSVESRIRKFTVKSEHTYFYQIEKKGEYRNAVASIEYEDLAAILGSIEVLKSQFAEDSSRSPDYLENKFVTTDGFKVGYYLSGAQSSWYIVLDGSSDETIFINDVDRMIAAFDEARLKIESLRK